MKSLCYGALALCCGLLPALAAADTRLLVIVGLGGDPVFAVQFRRWADTLIDAARVRYGLTDEQIVLLADPLPAPAREPAAEPAAGASAALPARRAGDTTAPLAEATPAGGSAPAADPAAGNAAGAGPDAGQQTGAGATAAAAAVPHPPDGRPTAVSIRRTLARLAADGGPDDDTVIVLIGHGSSRGGGSAGSGLSTDAGRDRGDGGALFNIPGPDLSAADYADLLAPFRGRVAFVNTAPVSGPFVAALSAPGRVVISATDRASERFSTRFGGYFVEAFAGDGADVDKDRRVSLLEAFDYARLETRRFYDDDRRLQTEHALLDDNGDGRGSRRADDDAGADREPAAADLPADGELARTLFLQGPVSALTDDPVRAVLLQDQRGLERELDLLRQEKNALAPEVYRQRLEGLLIEMALLKRRLRATGPDPEEAER